MKILVHCDAQTREPLGVWTISSPADPSPTYIDETARQHGQERLAVYKPPVDWDDVAEQLAVSSPYHIWWDVTELPANSTPEDFLERARSEWAGIKGPTSSSEFQARARRLRFARGQAGGLASKILGGTPKHYDPGQKVSEFTVLFRSADDQQLVVLVPHGELGKNVDQALAFGLVFQGDRDLHLVLPDGQRKVPRAADEPYATATLRRLAFICTPVRVWTHDTDGQLSEHPVPPRDQALGATRLDEAIPAKTYSLRDREAWVTSLAQRADEILDPAHTNSYLSWHIDGRQALQIKRTRSGLRITAGTNYGDHRVDKTPPEVVELSEPPTAAEQQRIWAAVDRTIAEREAGGDTENLEHLLQARLDTAGGRAALKLGDRLERELAATRPGQRRAYVDLVGVDSRGHIHIIETKLGLDVMLGLQGLDYWMWATEHREELTAILRQRGHHLADKPKVLLDYVVGGKADDGGSPDVRYLTPVAEALAGEISWKIGAVNGWRSEQLTISWNDTRRSPPEPRRPEQPRFALRLTDHLSEAAESIGGTEGRVHLKDPERAVIAPARQAYRDLVTDGHAHRYLNHVRSSQLFAINLFGGLSHDQATAVARLIDPEIVAADRPILEWVDPHDRLRERTHASPHATQIDVVIRATRGDGSRHLLLIEVKLSEDGFGECSAYHDARNDRRDLCRRPAAFGGEPAGCFKLRNHDREQRRRYDEYVPVWNSFDAACPFRGSGYQPMRQAALAAMLVEEGETDHASIVLCAHDDHQVIQRRWREATGALQSPIIGIHELAASRVLGELRPDHALELASRYQLKPAGTGAPDQDRLLHAAFQAEMIMERLSSEGGTLEQLQHLESDVDPALVLKLAQRLEQLSELARATREHLIGPALHNRR